MNGKQKTYSVIILLLLAYFLLRTINLTILPIFNDESTYIRYGMHQLNEPDHQPYSLLIGKEPLLPFLYASIGTAINNLLVGGRLVTILFGFFTLAGLYLFTKEAFNKRAALFASLFYIITPYTIFFDRLALLDSPVSTIAVWTLYATYHLLKKPQWRYGLFLGFLMGLGLWMKSSTLFYIFLPLISYAIFYVIHKDKYFMRAKILGTSLVLGLIIFLPLFSNPFYQELLVLNQQYTYPFFSVFFFPFPVWWFNLSSVFSWLFFYLTPPLFLLAFFSVILLFKRKNVWLVMLWLIPPLVYEILYAKLFTSRHSLLLTVPLCIMAGYGLSLLWEKRRAFVYVVLVIFLVWGIYDDSVLLTNPQQYPSLFAGPAKADAQQYMYGFSSGYGVMEAINYLEQASQNRRIVVLIRNDHGNPEDAVVAYLDYRSNIVLGLMNNPTVDIQTVYKDVGNSMPIYFVSRGAFYAGLEKYFAVQKHFNKPNDTEFVGVEQLRQPAP